MSDVYLSNARLAFGDNMNVLLAEFTCKTDKIICTNFVDSHLIVLTPGGLSYWLETVRFKVKIISPNNLEDRQVPEMRVELATSTSRHKPLRCDPWLEKRSGWTGLSRGVRWIH
jgi:hypothetical protein